MAINISTLTLNAPIQKVWAALTVPAQVKQWQYGSDLTTDWQPESPIRFTTAWQDKLFEQWGKVIDVREPELIKYSLFAPAPGLEDEPGNYFIMSYILTADGNKTKLEIIQEDNRPGAAQEKPQGEEHPILQALKTFVESA